MIYLHLITYFGFLVIHALSKSDIYLAEVRKESFFTFLIMQWQSFVNYGQIINT